MINITFILILDGSIHHSPCDSINHERDECDGNAEDLGNFVVSVNYFVYLESYLFTSFFMLI